MRPSSLLIASAFLCVSLPALADALPAPDFTSSAAASTTAFFNQVTPLTSQTGTFEPALNLQAGTAGFNPDTKAPPGPVVPEPSSLILLGTGLLGITSAVRRRLRF